MAVITRAVLAIAGLTAVVVLSVTLFFVQKSFQLDESHTHVIELSGYRDSLVDVRIPLAMFCSRLDINVSVFVEATPVAFSHWEDAIVIFTDRGNDNLIIRGIIPHAAPATLKNSAAVTCGGITSRLEIRRSVWKTVAVDPPHALATYTESLPEIQAAPSFIVLLALNVLISTACVTVIATFTYVIYHICAEHPKRVQKT